MSVKLRRGSKSPAAIVDGCAFCFTLTSRRLSPRMRLRSARQPFFHRATRRTIRHAYSTPRRCCSPSARPCGRGPVHFHAVAAPRSPGSLRRNNGLPWNGKPQPLRQPGEQRLRVLPGADLVGSMHIRPAPASIRRASRPIAIHNHLRGSRNAHGEHGWNHRVRLPAPVPQLDRIADHILHNPNSRPTCFIHLSAICRGIILAPSEYLGQTRQRRFHERVNVLLLHHLPEPVSARERASESFAPSSCAFRVSLYASVHEGGAAAHRLLCKVQTAMPMMAMATGRYGDMWFGFECGCGMPRVVNTATEKTKESPQGSATYR